MDSESCKQAIAAWCSDHASQVLAYFVVSDAKDGLGIVASASNPKNWKRMYKRRFGNGGWERAFDCKPLDDQLRAYVITTLDDERVLDILVRGE